MTRLITILTFFILASCSPEYDKAEVMEYFPEINHLNTILLKNQNQLEGRNSPDFISSKIDGTDELLSILQTNLNLTEIESYDTIRFRDNIQKSGIAYYFGDGKSRNKNYSILIFAENQESLELFQYYEQFTDCAKIETMDENWAFSTVNPNCNN